MIRRVKLPWLCAVGVSVAAWGVLGVACWAASRPAPPRRPAFYVAYCLAAPWEARPAFEPCRDRYRDVTFPL